MTTWIAGWNMAGYMPDMEPAEFEEFEDAKGYVLSAMDAHADDLEEQGDSEKAADVSLLAEEINLESGEFSATVAGYAYWVTTE